MFYVLANLNQFQGHLKYFWTYLQPSQNFI